MKILASTAIALALTLSACNRQEATAGNEPAAAEAAADDMLSGTWKADLASVKSEGKPDEFQLQGTTYTCSTCIPPLTVAADGAYHAVADRPYYDSISIKAVDARTVEVRRRKGDKEVSSTTLTVSEDGNVLTRKFTDGTRPNAPPVVGSSTAQRAGPAAAGAHAISGQWQPDSVGEISEDALTVTYSFAGNSVTSTAQGETWTAEVGGPAVAIKGDIGGTTVAIAREGANGLRETYTRGGKVVSIVTVMPSADGKTMTGTSTDPRDGSKSSWTGTKTS